MKAFKIIYYITLSCTILLMVGTCANGFMSAPWTVGMFYPAIYGTIALFIISFIMFFSFKIKHALIITLILFLFQLVVFLSLC